MSTKVFDLYKYYKSDIFELHNDLLKIRKLQTEIVKKQIRGYSKLIDPEKSDNELRHMISNSTRKGMNDRYNIDSSACIYLHKGIIYAHFFGLEVELDTNKFSDFHYQNQSDKLDEISEKEWGEREIVVDEIFKDHITPAKAGFIFEFLTYRDAHKII